MRTILQGKILSGVADRRRNHGVRPDVSTVDMDVGTTEYYTRVGSAVLGYCGGVDKHADTWDSRFVVEGLAHDSDFRYLPNEEIYHLMNKGADIYRSLQSRAGTVVFLDIDHIIGEKEKFHGERERAFREMEPHYRAVTDFLDERNIDYIVVVPASGYHVVFRIPFAASAHSTLRRAGSPHPRLLEQYERFPASPGLPLINGEAHAFDGAGKLIEYIARHCMRRTTGNASLGRLSDSAVGYDISTYSDPLHLRFIRCAGSLHRKYPPRTYATILRRDRSGNELGLDESLSFSEDLKSAVAILSQQDSAVPTADEKEATDLLHEYTVSDLARWHRQFDEYRPPWREIARCRDIIRFTPDDALKSESGIRDAVMNARREGRHPRAMAEAVAERYLAMSADAVNFRWTTGVTDGYNPYSRANLFARVYGYDR